MRNRLSATFVAAALLVGQCLPSPALAENKMGYKLMSPQDASMLPHNHGALGLDVERSQQISDGGMTFDIIRVKQARRGSPGAQAGLKAGDQLIAIDGWVFPSVTVFAAYINSIQAGTRIAIDYIPSGGGPQQAQRLMVTTGGGNQAGANQEARSGMGTGEKVAIGVGAVALLGCYEMGCFSHRQTPQAPTMVQQPSQ